MITSILQLTRMYWIKQEENVTLNILNQNLNKFKLQQFFVRIKCLKKYRIIITSKMMPL